MKRGQTGGEEEAAEEDFLGDAAGEVGGGAGFFVEVLDRRAGGDAAVGVPDDRDVVACVGGAGDGLSDELDVGLEGCDWW